MSVFGNNKKLKNAVERARALAEQRRKAADRTYVADDQADGFYTREELERNTLDVRDDFTSGRF